MLNGGGASKKSTKDESRNVGGKGCPTHNHHQMQSVLLGERSSCTVPLNVGAKGWQCAESVHHF